MKVNPLQRINLGLIHSTLQCILIHHINPCVLYPNNEVLTLVRFQRINPGWVVRYGRPHSVTYQSMPISALSDETVRRIGSSVVLTDSVSVVKELVDNALDARASSVHVEISLNSLAVIQVKDNGHGVAPEDRPMLGHRHCTSKIRDLDDLSSLGGQSLGFRGEALASIIEMSGGLTLSTRIEGERVGTAIKIDREGKR